MQLKKITLSLNTDLACPLQSWFLLIAMNSNWFYFAKTVTDDACYICSHLIHDTSTTTSSSKHAHLSCVNSCWNFKLKLIQNVSKVKVRRKYIWPNSFQHTINLRRLALAQLLSWKKNNVARNSLQGFKTKYKNPWSHILLGLQIPGIAQCSSNNEKY